MEKKRNIHWFHPCRLQCGHPAEKNLNDGMEKKLEIRDGNSRRHRQAVFATRIWVLLFCFCSCFCRGAVPWFSASVRADSSNGAGVYDFYGLLDGDEEAELNERLQEIREDYQFDGAILITDDMWEDGRRYAAEFMREYDVGYGSERNGMCLFHQPDSRTITVVFRGTAQDAFDTDVQDVILDDCTEYLREGNFFGGYMAALDDLEKGLVRFSRGKSIRPMDLGGPGMGVFLLYSLVGSVLVTAIPVFGIVWYQKSRMRSQIPQPNADFYGTEDGVTLDRERDIFVRTAVTRTRISQPSSGSGNSGGSFRSGGEKFSGSNRKY